MLFSLKLQRDNRQNALAVAPADAEEPGKKPHKQNALFMDPAKGEAGKRLYFHRTVEMKQPHAITEP